LLKLWLVRRLSVRIQFNTQTREGNDVSPHSKSQVRREDEQSAPPSTVSLLRGDGLALPADEFAGAAATAALLGGNVETDFHRNKLPGAIS